MSKENEKAIPTQEEYIAQQIAVKRAAALDKSRNRTSVRVPMVPNNQSEEEWNKNINALIESSEIALSKAMANKNYKLAKSKQEALERYLEEKDKGYPKLVVGSNCMYNAGDCYGLNIPGNQTFAAKHKELGFKKAAKGSMEPGDLVQDVRIGYPTHAMIYDSKDNEGNLLFNYARGLGDTDIKSDYIKQGKYTIPIKDYDVYKYVGTPADSTQWINEYKQIYGFGKGGIIGIPYYKKGSKIHIKKKNRGKFTEYCGGKVTDECIQKAKKSDNSKLVKRAVFAQNARGWSKKHADGGAIKAIAPSVGMADFTNNLVSSLSETTAKGFFNTIKRRLYDNIFPYNYGNDVQGTIGRIIDSVWKNKQEALPSDEYSYDVVRDDIFAEYLGIPSNRRHDITDIMSNDANDKKHLVIPSEYKPAKQTDSNVEYKTINKITDQDILKATNYNYDADYIPRRPLEFNENRTVRGGGLEKYFGTYTVGRGVDPTKGEYRSFYDLWDLNPFYGKNGHDPDNIIEKTLNKISGNADASLGIGKPIEFYDRVYLDDFYGVNSQPKKGDYYGGYLPEIEIFGFGKGGTFKSGSTLINRSKLLKNHKEGGEINNKDADKSSDKKPKKKLVVKRQINPTGMVNKRPIPGLLTNELVAQNTKKNETKK